MECYQCGETIDEEHTFIVVKYVHGDEEFSHIIGSMNCFLQFALTEAQEHAVGQMLGMYVNNN